MREGNYFGHFLRSNLSPCPATFGENGSEYSGTITERTNIARPVDPLVLKARDLGDNQPGLGNTDMDKSLDFESVAPQPTVRFFRWRRCDIKAERREFRMGRLSRRRRPLQ